MMKIHSYLPLLTLFLGALSPHSYAQNQPVAANVDSVALDLVQLKPPSLIVKRSKKEASSPLRVVALDVKVIVTGNTAETTMTMTFRNDTDRILEGELLFPLAQGMTVSRYALEVNGAMRQGVIVEKERARAIYEDTIRQKIDPGLVEWTKGNNFRTRIYPILAKGTKMVSVSYIETLESDGTQLNYQLALAYREKLDDFKLNISVIRPDGEQKIIVDETAGLKLTIDDSKQWTLKAHQKNFAANKPLKVAIPHENIASRLVYKNENGETFFYAIDLVRAEQKLLARPVPKTLHLIWDASNSGAKRDHAKELVLLESYLKESDYPTVTLQLLRNTLQKPEKFYGTKGAARLLALLRNIRYDGATRLGALDLRGMSSDAVVLVSDGISTLGQKRPHLGSKPVFIFHASQSAEHGLLDFIGSKSGGAYINLQKNDTTAGLNSMISQQFSLLSITGKGVKDVFPSITTPVKKYASIAGKITSGKPVTLSLNYGIAGKIMHTSEISVDPSDVSKDAASVPRLWAQKKVLELDSEAEKNRFEIVSLAQQYGIVTRFTSLLVLDRMEDYVRHRITPPEPELQKEYLRLVKDLPDPDQLDKAHLANLIGQWKEMLTWHKTPHLNFGELLIQQTTKINVEIDTAEKRITAQLATEDNNDKRTALQKQLHAIAKVRTIQKQASEWGTKRATTPTAPDAAYHAILKDFHEAIGVKALRWRIKPASPSSSMVRQMTDNSDAPTAIPVPNIAISEPPIDFGQSDDFGEGWGGGDGLGGSSNTLKKFISEENTRTAGATLAVWDPNTPYLKALRKAAKGNQDTEALYFEWKKKNESSSAFYLDVADFFYQQKQTDLAIRVLSNVAELDMENPALLRILGHRYDQLGQFELAEIIFREVLSLRSDEPQSYRDLALILEKRAAYQEAADKLWHVTSRTWDSRLEGIQLIALTELNALIARHGSEIDTAGISKDLIHNLDVDIRIILTWDADNTDIDLWVTDPFGEKCYYSHNRTMTGGRMSRDFTEGYGPEVFMIKHALNGNYTVEANYYGNSQQKLAGETTIQATLVTNWGRSNEKRQAITLRLKENKEIVAVGKLNFTSE